MSQTTVNLGYVLINRGEYVADPVTKYYKDNVVQYQGSAFIAAPVDYDEETNPLAYVTVAPYDTDPNNPNEGWKVFASDAAYVNSFMFFTENPEWVYVVCDKEDKILFGVKQDGEFYFGAGVPPQVQEYVMAKIQEFSPENYDQVIAFLQDFLGSDTTLKMLLDAKADKEDVEKIENRLNKLNLAIDPDRGVLRIGNKMFKLIDYTGPADFDEDIDYTIFIEATTTLENPEWQQAITDSEDRLLYGKKQDSGEEYWPQDELEGYTMTVDGVTASVNSIIRNIK